MFHPLNATICFGEAQPNTAGKAHASTTLIKWPDSSTLAPGSEGSKDSVPKKAAGSAPAVQQKKASIPENPPAPQLAKSPAATKATPSDATSSRPKSLPEHVKSLSEVERNNLIAKLIDIMGKQQAQLNEQQAQLDDYFQEQQYLNSANGHVPVNGHPAQKALAQHNPFLKPEAAMTEKAIPLSENIYKAPLRFLSALFPAKYMKNLPMNFLESFVQNAGATTGSRAADLFHEKVIYPKFVKKPPPPKTSPVKDAFKDASRLAPEFFARSVIDSLMHRFALKIVP